MTQIGMRPTEETLLMAKQQMIFAATAARLLPLGFIASVSNYGDSEAFRQMVRRSREFGFAGSGPGSGLWRSIDGGDTWSRVTSGMPAGGWGPKAKTTEVITMAATPDHRRSSAPCQ